MKGLRKFLVGTIGASAFALCFTTGTVHAAEGDEIVEVAVVHEYTQSEGTASDDWFAIARGTYLSSGTSTVTCQAVGKMMISATTNAWQTCDSVKAAAYLDESSDGGRNFYAVANCYNEDLNTGLCYVSMTSIKATSGWWYQTRGVHAVKEGSTIETSTSKTAAITAY